MYLCYNNALRLSERAEQNTKTTSTIVHYCFRDFLLLRVFLVMISMYTFGDRESIGFRMQHLMVVRTDLRCTSTYTFMSHLPKHEQVLPAPREFDRFVLNVG
jgi:hypothetical protein